MLANCELCCQRKSAHHELGIANYFSGDQWNGSWCSLAFIIKAISDAMKSSVCAQIVQNESKILQIVDEMITVSKKSCLILYLNAKVDKSHLRHYIEDFGI